MSNEVGLKMMKIVNPRSVNSPNIMEYKNFTPEDEQEVFLKEMQLISLKFKFMSIKVGERVPFISQIDEHKWFITKDKYGIFYFMLVSDIFEEKYVFKLQKKGKNLVDFYYDDLEDEKKAEVLTERIEQLVNQYNNALSKNAQAGVLISPDNSAETVKLKEDMNYVFEPKPEGEPESIDPEEVFVKLDARNKRLKLIQIVSLSATALAFILAILQVYLFLNKKK